MHQATSVPIAADALGRGDYVSGPDGSFVEIVDIVIGEQSVIIKPNRGEPFTVPRNRALKRLRPM